MRIWLATVGEPLPIDGGTDRLWRTGLVAKMLAERGHNVLWWASTVDHNRKEFFVRGEPKVLSTIGASIQFLDGGLYRRNVSLKRLRNHRQIADRFRLLAHGEDQPDVILCSFPTIELSRECVKYALDRGIPVVLDVRDLWPDIFLEVLPSQIKLLGRMVLRRQFRDAAWALTNSDCLFGVSDGYLDWGLARAGRRRGTGDKVYPLAYPKTRWTALDEISLTERLRACGVDPTRPMATFVGTFGRTYDLGSVISGARLLSERRGKAMQFVLCGAGEREREWRTAAAMASGVAFPGWLSAGELSCLLSRSTIGLAAYAPGAPQGLPNKLIEYLSAGLPVLCTLNGEARQLLESHGCGLYYAPGDPHDFATQLDRLCGDSDLRSAMSGAARTLFARRFSAESVYGCMVDQLVELAAGGAKC
jgi:glycosyltransferase involved in cell wall biosynthesis